MLWQLRNSKEAIVTMTGMCQECVLWLPENKHDKEASPIQAGAMSCVVSHMDIWEIFVQWPENREGHWFCSEHWISKPFYMIKRWSSILMGFYKRANLFTPDLWKEGLKVQPIDIWRGVYIYPLQGLNNHSLYIRVCLFTREKSWEWGYESFTSTYFP